MTLFASLFPIACWLAYNYGVPFVERRRPSLSVIMSMQRRRWVANATRRESPLDAILSGNLMQAVSLLASTSALIVLAIFAAIGQAGALVETLEGLGFGHVTPAAMQFHLLVLLAIFVLELFLVHAVAAPVQPFLHHARRDRPRSALDRGGDRRHRDAQFAGGQELQQRHPRLLFRGAGGGLVRVAAAGDRRSRW